MEPVTITLAVIALIASGVSVFMRRLQRCKASKCCEIEMNVVVDTPAPTVVESNELKIPSEYINLPTPRSSPFIPINETEL